MGGLPKEGKKKQVEEKKRQLKEELERKKKQKDALRNAQKDLGYGEEITIAVITDAIKNPKKYFGNEPFLCQLPDNGQGRVKSRFNLATGLLVKEMKRGGMEAYQSMIDATAEAKHNLTKLANPETYRNVRNQANQEFEENKENLPLFMQKGGEGMFNKLVGKHQDNLSASMAQSVNPYDTSGLDAYTSNNVTVDQKTGEVKLTADALFLEKMLDEHEVNIIGEEIANQVSFREKPNRISQYVGCGSTGRVYLQKMTVYYVETGGASGVGGDAEEPSLGMEGNHNKALLPGSFEQEEPFLRGSEDVDTESTVEVLCDDLVGCWELNPDGVSVSQELNPDDVETSVELNPDSNETSVELNPDNVATPKEVSKSTVGGCVLRSCKQEENFMRNETTSDRQRHSSTSISTASGLEEGTHHAEGVAESERSVEDLNIVVTKVETIAIKVAKESWQIKNLRIEKEIGTTVCEFHERFIDMQRKIDLEYANLIVKKQIDAGIIKDSNEAAVNVDFGTGNVDFGAEVPDFGKQGETIIGRTDGKTRSSMRRSSMTVAKQYNHTEILSENQRRASLISNGAGPTAGDAGPAAGDINGVISSVRLSSRKSVSAVIPPVAEKAALPAVVENSEGNAEAKAEANVNDANVGAVGNGDNATADANHDTAACETENASIVEGEHEKMFIEHENRSAASCDGYRQKRRERIPLDGLIHRSVFVEGHHNHGFLEGIHYAEDKPILVPSAATKKKEITTTGAKRKSVTRMKSVNAITMSTKLKGKGSPAFTAKSTRKSVSPEKKYNNKDDMSDVSEEEILENIKEKSINLQKITEENLYSPGHLEALRRSVLFLEYYDTPDSMKSRTNRCFGCECACLGKVTKDHLLIMSGLVGSVDMVGFIFDEGWLGMVRAELLPDTILENIDFGAYEDVEEEEENAKNLQNEAKGKAASSSGGTIAQMSKAQSQRIMSQHYSINSKKPTRSGVPPGGDVPNFMTKVTNVEHEDKLYQAEKKRQKIIARKKKREEKEGGKESREYRFLEVIRERLVNFILPLHEKCWGLFDKGSGGLVKELSVEEEDDSKSSTKLLELKETKLREQIQLLAFHNILNMLLDQAVTFYRLVIDPETGKTKKGIKVAHRDVKCENALVKLDFVAENELSIVEMLKVRKWKEENESKSLQEMDTSAIQSIFAKKDKESIENTIYDSILGLIEINQERKGLNEKLREIKEKNKGKNKEKDNSELAHEESKKDELAYELSCLRNEEEELLLNILACSRFRAIVIDWDRSAIESVPSTAIGTARYQAPECEIARGQFTNQKKRNANNAAATNDGNCNKNGDGHDTVDGWDATSSDVFSLGIAFYRLLVGEWMEGTLNVDGKKGKFFTEESSATFPKGLEKDEKLVPSVEMQKVLSKNDLLAESLQLILNCIEGMIRRDPNDRDEISTVLENLVVIRDKWYSFK